MLSKISAFVLVMGMGLSASADLLNDSTYNQTPSTSCYEAVYNAAYKYIPAAKRAENVVPVSHVTTTPGTYGQIFISLINVGSDYYTMVSEGEYSCDSMKVVSVQKVQLPPEFLFNQDAK